MSGKRLSYEDFLKSFELCPRLTVELIIVNSENEALLLRRESEPFKGHWHLPGGFLLKDEKLDDCTQRIASDEVGLSVDSDEAKFMGVFETLEGDPRGHIIHYVVKIFADDLVKNENQKLFSSIPETIIPYQRKLLQNITPQMKLAQNKSMSS